MTQYSAEFKTKIVLEVLKGDKTINEIASEYNIIPKNIQNWKNIFLANAVVAMEPAKAVKEYKDEIEKLKAKNDEYAKIVGKLTVENNWMSGKLKSLDSKKRQDIVEFKLSDISITRQSELLGVARSGLYYLPKINEEELAMCGSNKGIAIGFACGLLVDVFYGDVIGFNALIYMYCVLFSGIFRRWFYSITKYSAKISKRFRVKSCISCSCTVYN